MFEAVNVDAAALCTPPQMSGDLARAAVARGKQVLLEKPPAGTVAEALTLEPYARARGVTMFDGLAPLRWRGMDDRLESRGWRPGGAATGRRVSRDRRAYCRRRQDEE